MNQPATGPKTPAAKRMKMSANSTAIIVPPSPAIRAEELARALAYVRAKDATAAAAAKASNEDDDMDEDDE